MVAFMTESAEHWLQSLWSGTVAAAWHAFDAGGRRRRGLRVLSYFPSRFGPKNLAKIVEILKFSGAAANIVEIFGPKRARKSDKSRT